MIATYEKDATCSSDQEGKKSLAATVLWKHSLGKS